MRIVRFVGMGGIAAMLACNGSSTSTTGPGGGSTTPPSGSVADVTIRDFAFAPAAVSVPVGTTVRWTNTGPSVHTTTSDDGAWNSSSLNPPGGGGGYGGGGGTAGGSFAFTFTQAGTFGYHCSNHPPAIYPGFVGTVTVTP